ncbi:MAG: sulfurtransferase TusA family protein [Fibrobacter sp.]|jgi:TusA-related sulfurtransferase|nr:sulfurtransferase TusA family protein [Fibrobacter sp.]
MFENPMQKWLKKNQNHPNFDKNLQALLGYACIDLLRRNFPQKPVFSLEKAFFIVCLHYQVELKQPLLEWMSKPLEYAQEIVEFAENSSKVILKTPFPMNLDQEGVLDLRGVGCPESSVRAKLVLAGLASGARLQIFVDNGYPIENLPQTLISEGCLIEKRHKKESFWHLVVLKKEKAK